MMVYRTFVAAKPCSTTQQFTAPIGHGCKLAEIPLACRTARAFTARRKESENDPITHCKPGVVGISERLDDAGRLMPQHHWQGARPVPVHDRKITVANSRRVDADKKLAGARRGKIERNQFQRTRGRIGSDAAFAMQHGGHDFSHHNYPDLIGGSGFPVFRHAPRRHQIEDSGREIEGGAGKQRIAEGLRTILLRKPI